MSLRGSSEKVYKSPLLSLIPAPLVSHLSGNLLGFFTIHNTFKLPILQTRGYYYPNLHFTPRLRNCSLELGTAFILSMSTRRPYGNHSLMLNSMTGNLSTIALLLLTFLLPVVSAVGAPSYPPDCAETLAGSNVLSKRQFQLPSFGLPGPSLACVNVGSKCTTRADCQVAPRGPVADQCGNELAFPASCIDGLCRAPPLQGPRQTCDCFQGCEEETAATGLRNTCSNGKCVPENCAACGSAPNGLKCCAPGIVKKGLCFCAGFSGSSNCRTDAGKKCIATERCCLDGSCCLPGTCSEDGAPQCLH